MILYSALLCLRAFHGVQSLDLPAGPGPLDNPLKGFASYCAPGTPLEAPVSMAFEETSWKELEPKEGVYAFDAWEAKSWNPGPAAGKPVVLRVFLDYPAEPVAVPNWLVEKGVRMTHYDEFGGGYSPDYEDPKLTNSLLEFVRAFGKRYDRDPRVAYIQVGLLGHWGEWHTYPHDALFASARVQTQVIEAMHAAFPDKLLMARNAQYKSCQLPWLGFHDDMIPDDTLGAHDWEFLPAIKKGGVGDNWKVAPLGGEMVPFAAKQYLGKDWALLQDAVRQAHFTWIGPYCPAMEKNLTGEDKSRIDTLIRALGYQFKLEHATIPVSISAGEKFSIKVRGSNEGVAPIYVPWRPTFALIDADGTVKQRITSSSDARTWLPGLFTVTASASTHLPAGTYRVGLGIVDPETGKARISFANHLDTVEGFAVLGAVEVAKL